MHRSQPTLVTCAARKDRRKCVNMTRRIPLQVLSLVLLQQTLCSSMEIHLSIQEEQNEGVRIGTIAREFPPPYRLLTTYLYVELDTTTGDLYTTAHTIDREALCPQQPLEPCLIQLLAVVGPSDEVIKVRLEIEDVNDNSPHFQDDEIHLSVPEDIAEGTSFLLDHQARDEDAGSNGELWYSLDGADGLFSVTEEGPSLVVVVRGRLDREAQGTHRMTVIATDRGVPSRTATATLVVEVTDVNDNCPTFSSDSPYTAVIPGDSPRGTVVTHVKATDPDLGSNAVITYSFSPKISDRSKALFKMDSNTGLITLSTDIDSGSLSEHVLRVLASGPSCPPAVAEVTVSVQPAASQGLEIKISSHEKVITVLVEDVNDNAPQFQQTHYHLDLEENNEPGTSLLQVRAIDADSQQNSEVAYSLNPNMAAMFSINTVTGQLFVLFTLDREKQEFHNFTILARDNGSPTLQSSVGVSIRVLDQNDNNPIFTTTDFIFFIPENFPRLGQVGAVGVTDVDTGSNGRVEVQVLNSSSPFQMDNARGTLRCIAEVDREMQDRYELWLLARDHGRPPLSSTARVTVFVEDVNDNQPRVILPASNLSCLIVSPSTVTGTTVTKIYAIDEDSGKNSDISYRIAASEPREHSPFLIDAQSGNVTLGQSLLLRDHGLHHLFIVVSDGGEPTPLESAVWVNLLVNDTHEPCRLSREPVSYPVIHKSPRKPSPCERDESSVNNAQMMLFIGFGMMATFGENRANTYKS
ncbi:hypothetical protein MATL_G00171040 [Megalops atlanticus]|uniref:Protocadherin-20 n=1 Tax=Megalops atlanticus TaxID=7932 RepID=A0A9D3PPA6_MEGAT|nr:hypothetical protein MATL_G00171040 [Megalops atlanticus]